MFILSAWPHVSETRGQTLPAPPPGWTIIVPNDSETRRADLQFIADALATRGFGAIEAAARQFREEGTLHRDGRSMQLGLYLPLADPKSLTSVTPEAGFPELEAILKSWSSESPDSAVARVALAEFYIAYAWAARGSGSAGTVTADGWKLFGERLDQAEAVLTQSKELVREELRHYRALITLGMAKSWEFTKIQEAFREAQRRAPASFELYYGVAYERLPRWHGKSHADWHTWLTEALADAALEEAQKDEVYAQVALEIISFAYDGGTKLNAFELCGVDWPRLKRGSEILLTKFPDSSHLPSKYLRAAVDARDFATAKSIVERMQHRYDPIEWRGTAEFESVLRRIELGETIAGLESVKNQFQAAYDLHVSEKHAQAMAQLNAKYLAALERALQNANRATAAALTEELQRVKAGEPLPSQDHPLLLPFRSKYRGELARVNQARDQAAAPIVEKFAEALEQRAAELTQSRNVDGAFAVRLYAREDLTEKLSGTPGGPAAYKPKRASTNLRILIEDSHEQAPAANIYNFGLAGAAKIWRELGHDVESSSDVIAIRNRPLAGFDFKGYDLIVSVGKMGTSLAGFSEAECQLFADYVYQGGWLLLAGSSQAVSDGTTNMLYAPLLKRFGASFNAVNPSSGATVRWSDSPLSRNGSSDFYCLLPYSAGIELDSFANADVLADSDGTPVVAKVEFGLGTVLLFGSSMALMNTTVDPPLPPNGQPRTPHAGNVQLLKNLARWRQDELAAALAKQPR